MAQFDEGGAQFGERHANALRGGEGAQGLAVGTAEFVGDPGEFEVAEEIGEAVFAEDAGDFGQAFGVAFEAAEGVQFHLGSGWGTVDFLMEGGGLLLPIFA